MTQIPYRPLRGSGDAGPFAFARMGLFANPVRAVVALIVVTAAIRLGLAAAVGLGIDESYTVGISRQFSLSYLDHPPLHLWLVGGWARLTHSEHPLLLRLPFIGLFAGSTWLMFRLTTLVYDARAGLWAAVALNLGLAFTVSTAGWVLPDGPLVFFVLLGGLVLARLFFATPAASPAWWLAAGAAGGLAMLSKYLGAFFFAGIGLFLLTSPKDRHRIVTPWPWFGAIVAAMLLLPVVVWNMGHGWASFAFQGRRGLPQGIQPEWLLQDIGGQFVYLLPLVTLPFVLARALWRGPRDRGGWFFACLAIGPVAFFTLTGLWSRILPHWPMMGWLFALPLLGAEAARLERTRPARLSWSIAASAAAIALALAVLTTQAATGWITRMTAALLNAPDPTLVLLDWRELNSELRRRDLLRPGMVVAGPHWIDAGKLSYALGKDMPVLCLCADPHHFAFLQDANAFEGRDALLIGEPARMQPQLAAMAARFERIEPRAGLVLTRAGQPAVTLQIAAGFGLKAGAP